MELRKLYSDCSTKEKSELRKYIGKDYKLTKHTIFRKQERRIMEEEINRVFDNFEVVEIHIKDGDKRVLLRGKTVEQGNINICVVVSLDSGDIVTTYYNSAKDKHYTLDYSKYLMSWIDISGLLKINTYSVV